MDLNHERISPTAKMVSYWRQFTDIPYSKDVADLFRVQDAYQELFGADIEQMPKSDDLIPFLEIRYKSIQSLLLETKASQVLEFASGISLRGLAMTKDPNLVYVETDLPALTSEKLKLLSAVIEKNAIPPRDNLFFATTNILHWEEIEPALSHFDPKKPVAIVHEGLMQYLTKEEKSIAANHIHRILKRFGGMWITPDLDAPFNPKDMVFDQKKYQEFVDIIAKKTGRNFDTNVIGDEAQTKAFLAKHGFTTEIRPQMALPFTWSEQSQKVGPEIKKGLDALNLWVMRAT